MNSHTTHEIILVKNHTTDRAPVVFLWIDNRCVLNNIYMNKSGKDKVPNMLIFNKTNLGNIYNKYFLFQTIKQQFKREKNY